MHKFVINYTLHFTIRARLVGGLLKVFGCIHVDL